VTDLYPLTAAVTGVVGLASGLLVPGLIARIPEPEPDSESEVDSEVVLEQPDEADPEPAEPAEPKELYVAVAALPGLAWKAALAAGVSAALIGWVLGWDWPLLVLLPLVPISVALAVIDWRTKLLPTWLIAPTYLLTIVTVLLSWLLAGDLGEPWPLVRALLGWLLAGGLYVLLWLIYPRGMGYGDVRLSGILGIALGFLGWSELVVGIYGGFLLGGVIGGLLTVLRRVDRSGYPFGPFMLVGALVGVVLGQPIISALTV
jgi:leader peptidase (prepilin peptidase)/N-methyltransferase